MAATNNKEPFADYIDDEPMIEYRVTLFNRKHNRQEVYMTKASSSLELHKHIRIFTENGYDLVEAIAVDMIVVGQE